MKLVISTPVQLLLVTTVVGSAVLLLRPEPVELPLFAQKSSATGRRIDAKDAPRQDEMPWRRPAIAEPAASKTAIRQVSGLPPLPPADAIHDAGSTPPLPPLPQPVQPDVVYLGRMVKDGKVKVFFASAGDPVILGEGEVLNGNWRVEKISTASVTLLHVQTGETRMIAMGGGGDPRPSGVATVQVGPRFLASQPAQQQ